jgi:hypothetical protein
MALKHSSCYYTRGFPHLLSPEGWWDGVEDPVDTECYRWQLRHASAAGGDVVIAAIRIVVCLRDCLQKHRTLLISRAFLVTPFSH